MHQKAHGIMFHHFHDSKRHIVSQGSISTEQLEDLLDYYGEMHTILSADEFLYKSENNCLSETDVCITFDDALLCQYDVAYPVLKRRGIRAFWFIYTSPLTGVFEKLEIYRHFRFSKFSDIEAFYEAFFKIAKAEHKSVADALEIFDPAEYAKGFPFYTPNDKRFRFVRDIVLGETLYQQIMDKMIEVYDYSIRENANLLWMKENQLKELHENGHIIGLHSHTHPTLMCSKSFDAQCAEYGRNRQLLKEVLGSDVIAASYPCNSYNSDTIRCMQEMNIQIGFRANMENERISDTKLEYPREDHANILRQMEARKQ